MASPVGGVPPDKLNPANPSGNEQDEAKIKAMQEKWKYWIGPNATPDDIKKFLGQLLRDIITQIQKDEQKAKEAQQKMQAAEQGDDDNS